jgi:hypothetical protein
MLLPRRIDLLPFHGRCDCEQASARSFNERGERTELCSTLLTVVPYPVYLIVVSPSPLDITFYSDIEREFPKAKFEHLHDRDVGIRRKPQSQRRQLVIRAAQNVRIAVVVSTLCHRDSTTNNLSKHKL